MWIDKKAQHGISPPSHSITQAGRIVQKTKKIFLFFLQETLDNLVGTKYTN